MMIKVTILNRQKNKLPFFPINERAEQTSELIHFSIELPSHTYHLLDSELFSALIDELDSKQFQLIYFDPEIAYGTLVLY